MSVGIAMSGGSGFGAYQVGMLKAMRDLKLLDQVTLAAGTSTGALNSAGIAYVGIDELEKVWLSIRDTKDIFNSAWYKGTGLYSTEPLREILDRMLFPKDTKIEAVSCCVDLEYEHCPVLHISNREVSFKKFVDGVESSTQVPFTVALTDGGKCDGGVREYVPGEYVAERCDTTYILLTSPLPDTHQHKVKKPWYMPSGVWWGKRTIDSAFQKEIKKNDLIHAMRANPNVKIIAPHNRIEMDYAEFNPDKIRFLIQDGYDLAMEALG